MSKRINYLLLLFLIPLISHGAEVISFPKEKQLFSRDTNNNADVHFKIKNNQATQSLFSLVGIANGDTISSLSMSLNANEFWEFSIPISAGLINFSFFLYEKQNAVSNLVKKAENVVCGDVFVIYGQSNGLAIFGVSDYDTTLDDQWIRNAEFSNNTDLIWYNGKKPNSSMGVLGLWLAKQTVDGQEVPVAVINGCQGGQNIINLGERNEINPKDKTTFYGKLLSRVTDALSIGNIKGFIWFQGEAETSAGPQAMLDYGGKLDTLYSNIINDFPPINHFVLMQINLLKNGIGEAGIVRNFQANFEINNPKVDRLATVGKSFWYDGIHYSRQGYESLAEMLYIYFDKNEYSPAPVPGFKSPRLQKAVKDIGMNRLRLIFDDNQEVSMEEYLSRPYGRRYINPYIFINGQNHQIQSFENIGNEIRLEINNLSGANKITYLPSFFTDSNSPGYDGPVIKNAVGFSALTFYDYQIKELLQTPSYDKAFYKEKKLMFQLAPGAIQNCLDCVLKVERKKAESVNYEKRGSVNINSNLIILDTFNTNETSEQKWNYRIELENPSYVSSKLLFDIDVCAEINLTENQTNFGEIRGKLLTGETVLDESIKNVLFERSTSLLQGFETQAGKTVSIEQRNCVDQ
ncbi:hypothetical protein SAMN06298216_4253 [Spirosomataceae bacterium TFI 002]|nr:hypothetical protein SAMN06298216_4253 [Spirosomataceae bacterium TFI 002]